jgi:hypothetical protein
MDNYTHSFPIMLLIFSFWQVFPSAASGPVIELVEAPALRQAQGPGSLPAAAPKGANQTACVKFTR